MTFLVAFPRKSPLRCPARVLACRRAQQSPRSWPAQSPCPLGDCEIFLERLGWLTFHSGVTLGVGFTGRMGKWAADMLPFPFSGVFTARPPHTCRTLVPCQSRTPAEAEPSPGGRERSMSRKTDRVCKHDATAWFSNGQARTLLS